MNDESYVAYRSGYEDGYKAGVAADILSNAKEREEALILAAYDQGERDGSEGVDYSMQGLIIIKAYREAGIEPLEGE